MVLVSCCLAVPQLQRGVAASQFVVVPSRTDVGSFLYSDESPEDAKYDFSWEVSEEDGGNFGYHEARDGDNTQGSYSVDLPDGRRQTVTYYVNGDSGYVAEVSYSGEARYSDESDEVLARRI